MSCQFAFLVPAVALFFHFSVSFFVSVSRPLLFLVKCFSYHTHTHTHTHTLRGAKEASSCLVQFRQLNLNSTTPASHLTAVSESLASCPLQQWSTCSLPLSRQATPLPGGIPSHEGRRQLPGRDEQVGILLVYTP